MNVELLKRVADVIVANPHDFDMGNWIDKTEYTGVIEKDKSCGTVCCMAGWVVAVARADGSLKELRSKLDYGCIDGVCGTAVELLDVEDAEEALFYSDQWPEEFANRYEFADTDEERASAAYDRIHHFIATSGAE